MTSAELSSNRTDVAIVVPYVAEYSRRLFSDLHRELAFEGVSLHLLYGTPMGAQADRSDSVDLPFAFPMSTRQISTPIGTLDYKAISGYLNRKRVQYVIFEQALRHIETHLEVFRPLSARRSIAFWGHGFAHHRNEGSIASRIRMLFTHRAEWAFVYTAAGRERLVNDGFASSRITVVHNTIDTDALLGDLARVDEVKLNDFRSDWNLTPGKTGLFIGGVDESKGITDLINAAIEVASVEPEFRLIIGGAGNLSSLCAKSAEEFKFIKYLGPLHDLDKALALSAADFMVIPRRVGLVAVESIIAKLPLLTTDSQGHGPELAYCREFGNLRLALSADHGLANLILGEIRDPSRNEILEFERMEFDISYGNMLESLKSGILTWLSMPRVAAR